MPLPRSKKSYRPSFIPTALPVLLLGLALLGCAKKEQSFPVDTKPKAGFTPVMLDNTFGHREVADIDGDGLNDIVVGHNPDASGGFVAWYDFQSRTRHTIADSTTFERFKAYRSCGMAVGDIDGDGDPDVAARFGVPDSDTEGVMAWCENPLPDGDPAGRWTSHEIGANLYTKEIHLADFDRDGRMDVVSRENARVQVWFGEASGEWTKKEIDVPHHEGSDVADLDCDGDPDIVLNGCWLETPGNALGKGNMLFILSTRNGGNRTPAPGWTNSAR